MFKARKVFDRIKELAAGEKAAEPESNQIAQTDPQIARINALLDAAEKASAFKPQNGPAGSVETLRAEVSSLKKDFRDLLVLLESRNNEIAEERKNKESVRDLNASAEEALQHNEIKLKLSELEKKVSDLSREMSLDRAMPQANTMKLEKEIETMKKAIAANNADSFESLSSRIYALESCKNNGGTKSDMEYVLAANAELEKKCETLKEELSEMRTHTIELEKSIEAVKTESKKRENILPRTYASESRIGLPAGVGGANEDTEKMLKRLEYIRKSLNN